MDMGQISGIGRLSLLRFRRVHRRSEEEKTAKKYVDKMFKNCL
jgi:hypothetical protein